MWCLLPYPGTQDSFTWQSRLTREMRSILETGLSVYSKTSGKEQIYMPWKWFYIISRDHNLEMLKFLLTPTLCWESPNLPEEECLSIDVECDSCAYIVKKCDQTQWCLATFAVNGISSDPKKNKINDNSRQFYCVRRVYDLKCSHIVSLPSCVCEGPSTASKA